MGIIAAFLHYIAIIQLTIVGIILVATIIGIFAGGNTWTRFVALAFDFFWNVITGGKIGVTISSRSYVNQVKGVKGWGLLVTSLSKLEKDHCQLAVQGDIDRAKAVIAELSPYDTRNKS